MRAGRFKMKWKVCTTEYETVQQYVDVVQKKQFVAVAAGVVVHQHTRVLMADLHRRGDNMSATDVRSGLQQLAAEIAAAYKAADGVENGSPFLAHKHYITLFYTNS